MTCFDDRPLDVAEIPEFGVEEYHVGIFGIE